LTAGFVVAPRGLGSMMGLPIVGYISSRVDNRWLLTIGFTAFGVFTIWFANVNLSIGPTTMLIPIMLTGTGMAFLFVPIGYMATSSISNEQMGNATGIFNLLRNIGGSIGISMATTMLARRAAYHQSVIAAAVPQTGHEFQTHLWGLTGYLSRQMGHAGGHPAALAAMYMHLQRQAVLWAFVDVFRWTALVTFAAGCMVWLFRKVTHEKDGSVKVH
ncbi:MAG TPA: MFS transporter, partial [Acidobacteriaceae bacterium]|nr:MFS transporter [Acidobacteriaceae bacterium]